MYLNFDAAYCINLARRPDRWETFSKMINAVDWPFGPVERFEAVDGFAANESIGYREGRGYWGCWMSHLQVLRLSQSRGQKRILVFEDDAYLDAGRIADFDDKRADVVFLGGEYIRESLLRNHAIIYAVDKVLQFFGEPDGGSNDWRIANLIYAGTLSVSRPTTWFFGQSSGFSDNEQKIFPDRIWENLKLPKFFASDKCKKGGAFCQGACRSIHESGDKWRVQHAGQKYFACPHGLPMGWQKGEADLIAVPIQKLPNFDAAYCINLARRPDRWETFSKMINAVDWPFGPVERFEAVDGMGDGAKGCRESHLKVLHLAQSRGQKRILVFEDDAYLVPGWQESLRYVQAPEIWDLFYLGGQHHDGTIQRTHALGYSVDKVLEVFTLDHHHGHIDHRLGEFQKTGTLKAYAPLKWIFGQTEGASDISGAKDGKRSWNAHSSPKKCFRAELTIENALNAIGNIAQRTRVSPEVREARLAACMACDLRCSDADGDFCGAGCGCGVGAKKPISLRMAAAVGMDADLTLYGEEKGQFCKHPQRTQGKGWPMK